MSTPTLICGDRVAFGVIRHGTVKHGYKPLVSAPGDYNVLVAWDDGALLSHRASTLEKESRSGLSVNATGSPGAIVDPSPIPRYCASNWRYPLGKVSDHHASELKRI